MESISKDIISNKESGICAFCDHCNKPTLTELFKNKEVACSGHDKMITVKLRGWACKDKFDIRDAKDIMDIAGLVCIVNKIENIEEDIAWLITYTLKYEGLSDEITQILNTIVEDWSK
ncbi:MAG: hypothetical protein WC783_00615 [Candidatus Paceibacterota bacterium]|jgi:hypothetical protein